MKLIPKINKKIYKEIQGITGIDEEVVSDVVDYMWKGTALAIASGNDKAIHLRYLGTFHAKKEMVYMMEQARIKNKNKNNEQPTGELQ